VPETIQATADRSAPSGVVPVRGERWLRTIALITVAAVYFLIFVGASVRASGAGMGCPDWPTCFGSLVPPISESQLPPDYQQIYAERGYADTRFNPVKTWTEFFNRLVGATIGLLVLLTLIAAWGWRRQDQTVFRMALAAFVLVGFNGWLGSVVVETNLHPTVITTHMVAALATVGCLLWVAWRPRRAELSLAAPLSPGLKRLLWLLFGLSVLQLGLGVQVRELVDTASALSPDGPRGGWLAQAGGWLAPHALIGIMLSALSVMLALKLRLAGQVRLVWLWQGLVLLAVAQPLLGLALAGLGLPAMIQPLHLLTGSLLFGLLFCVWLAHAHAPNPSSGLSSSSLLEPTP